MKKIAILLGLSLLISMGMQAQKNKRTSAYMYNKNGEYKKAKEVIDVAILHEKTMQDAKTWLYRGEIYYNIAVSEDAEVKGLSENAADIAFESFINVKKYDPKNTYEGELALNLYNLTNLYYKLAGEGYNNRDYDVAINGYINVVAISELEGRYDTTAAFYAGMSGVWADNQEVATKYLEKCIEMDYNDARIYKFYSKSVKQLGDTTKALQVIEKGRLKYPDDLSLMLELAQIYLETGNNDKLREALLSAIDADKENPNLYLILGQTYDNDGEYEKALEYYQKTIDLGGENSSVYYNIGAIYSNEGKAYLDEAKDLPLNEVTKYEELVEKGNVELKQAMPYFEKALELDPNDKYSVLALKNIYIQLKMNDKLKELNDSN